MFFLTFCAPVLQNTLCVTYGAPRRSLLSRLWGGPLATWAAKPGQEFTTTPLAWILAAQGRHGMSRTTFPDLTASIFRPPKSYPP